MQYREAVKGREPMRYRVRFRAGDTVWYRVRFNREEYIGRVLGISTPQPPADEATYLVTLLSGPYAGQTSVVYEQELRPRVVQGWVAHT